MAMSYRVTAVRPGCGEDWPESPPASEAEPRGGLGVLSCSGISITIVPPAGCNSLVAYYPPVGPPVGLIWPPVGLILKRAAVPGAAPPFQPALGGNRRAHQEVNPAAAMGQRGGVDHVAGSA